LSTKQDKPGLGIEGPSRGNIGSSSKDAGPKPSARPDVMQVADPPRMSRSFSAEIPKGSHSSFATEEPETHSQMLSSTLRKARTITRTSSMIRSGSLEEKVATIRSNSRNAPSRADLEQLEQEFKEENTKLKHQRISLTDL